MVWMILIVAQIDTQSLPLSVLTSFSAYRRNLRCSQHSFERRLHDRRPILAGGEALQFVLFVKQVVGRHVSLLILEGVTQLMFVVDGGGIANFVLSNGFAHGVDVGVGWITRHVNRDQT